MRRHPGFRIVLRAARGGVSARREVQEMSGEGQQGRPQEDVIARIDYVEGELHAVIRFLGEAWARAGLPVPPVLGGAEPLQAVDGQEPGTQAPAAPASGSDPRIARRTSGGTSTVRAGSGDGLPSS